jgi:hypothetical protein
VPLRQEILTTLGVALSAEAVVTGGAIVSATVASLVALAPCWNVTVALPATTPVQLPASPITKLKLVTEAESVPLPVAGVTPAAEPVYDTVYATASVFVPVSAVLGVTVIVAVGVPVAVLHVRVAVEGVALRRRPAAFKPPEPTVNPRSTARIVVPCRLKTEESIMDHPFLSNFHCRQGPVYGCISVAVILIGRVVGML